MGFTWSSKNVGEPITPDEVNDIKSKVDQCRTKIGIPTPYNWTYFPVQKAQEISYDEWGELKNALDDTHNQNYCHSHFATQYSTVRSPHYVTNYNNVETGDRTSDYVSDCAHNGTYYTSVLYYVNTGRNCCGGNPGCTTDQIVCQVN